MFYRIYRSFLTLSIISCALSVSLSQLFLLLSFVFFLFLPEKPKLGSQLVKILFLFYVWQIVTVLYHFAGSGFDFNSIKHAFRDEMKDIFLVTAFVSVQGIKPEDKKYLYKTFFIFALVIVITGFISIFSMTRLSRLISDLYKTSASWPYQHHYGKISNINIYLPIGLMNTHLTFGGLLAFIFPGFVFRLYDSWHKKESLSRISINAILLLLVSIVFLFNNARSSLLGAVVSTLFGVYILIFIDKDISKKMLKRIGVFIILLIIIVSIGYKTTNAVKRVVDPLFGGEKHTDSGRTFIWDSTFPLIEKNPIFGIGSGNYQKEIEIARKEKEKEHKELSFFYEVTQRGHAHNDYFHLTAVYGAPQGILYLLLFAAILYTLLNGNIPKEIRFMTYGLVGFFFSGLLQCYFQDDEVLIVFYFLLGYLNLYAESNNKNELKLEG
ncbi:O-antigen ligase family protein [Leptospira sp. 2 VSF19]|uniref:O-antigen ligase family protein n=1 Tax=Leptospira soteropolitanensis TaxID=2950025 RepID=A0AAW5VJ07_9LEPT|nr:O-antigen ligase family protein [Leptospira soteropolitanensis]MCW7493875.1 O-antigen ligase family protein [Leptospira soteropolitanensis]MCW7501469.1 O-antigen ligase family protein [Leptospira soteropolitanensis]MCW7523768.1 O-antigen ligase family protein [Leptospira soteropolitanensis]MCW7527632.1 O-antigen ligase family protein [Leptospira soteropolitanensis]MCW7531486.1 O-antigen ligase family protein [Leptospira soteropolitanensis]